VSLVIGSLAIRTRVDDAALQAYIQRYPFLTGPDARSNVRALAAVREGTRVTDYADAPSPIRQFNTELMMTPDENAAAAAFLRQAGMREGAIAHATLDFSWRAARIPAGCRSMLCLGSGGGEELAFVRARAPRARLVVWDYAEKASTALLRAVNAQYKACDLVPALQDCDDKFEVVFSNHTLEHLFDPDRVLRLIHERLTNGGVLVSGLPLDADASVPHHRQVAALARSAATIRAIDLGLFDAGHPWKTSVADLRATLIDVGFTGVKIVQRADLPFRAPAYPAAAGYGPSALDRAMYHATFGPMRQLLGAALGDATPRLLCRVLVAAERRVPFGGGRMKNGGSPDVVVTAVKPN
jgi:SAM-dependent methyltransferase